MALIVAYGLVAQAMRSSTLLGFVLRAVVRKWRWVLQRMHSRNYRCYVYVTDLS